MPFCIGFKIDTLTHLYLQNRYSVVCIMLYFNILCYIATDTAPHFAMCAVSLLIQSILMIYILLDMVLYRFWKRYTRARTWKILLQCQRALQRENNELVMLFFLPSSQPFGSRPTRGCEQAHLGCWACSFEMLSRPVLNVELASLNCWAEKLFTTTGWHGHSSRWCSFRFPLLCLDSGSGVPLSWVRMRACRTNRHALVM